ncbi:MAG: hypothetical protein PHP44_13455 [Kiritimatiellae bacterium]|nr:hypothetical protein [Kiritimatiellia bacterium]
MSRGNAYHARANFKRKGSGYSMCQEVEKFIPPDLALFIRNSVNKTGGNGSIHGGMNFRRAHPQFPGHDSIGQNPLGNHLEYDQYILWF